MASGKRPFRVYLFSSFFAAAMVAATYAYYDWTYSRFNTIDFSSWIFYDQQGVFTPDQDHYAVLVYSSRQDRGETLLTKFRTEDPVLLLDLSQSREPVAGGRQVSAGMNTLLQLINRFHITETPVVFSLEREHGNLYRQHSSLLPL